MSGDWYYVRGGGFEGPQTASQLLELVKAGIIESQTAVWRQGLTDWQPLKDALALANGIPPPLPTSLSAPASAAIQREEATSAGSSHEALTSSAGGINAHEWRRLFARSLDTIIYGASAWFVIGAILSVVAPVAQAKLFELLGTPAGLIFNALGTVFFAIVPGAIVIGLTGSSLGKLIFGVKVLKADGSRIGCTTAFQRELLVWTRGLGLGLPIVQLFTMGAAQNRLKKCGKTTWDEQLGTTVNCRANGPLQVALNILGFTLLLLTYGAIRALNSM
jgi:uncharacterized RDD family membrane protein YckC